VLSQQGRPADSIPLRRRELASSRLKNGNSNPSTLTSINSLAIDLRESGALEEAEALFRELLAARMQVLEPSDFDIGRALGGLAKTLEEAGKLEEAVAYRLKALDHRLEHEGPDDWWTNRARLDLARVLQKLGRNSEAVPLLDELLASMGRNNEPDDDDRQLLADAEELMRSLDEGL
jgi:tetratricopeptide (TPR) repeat protein